MVYFSVMASKGVAIRNV